MVIHTGIALSAEMNLHNFDICLICCKVVTQPVGVTKLQQCLFPMLSIIFHCMTKTYIGCTVILRFILLTKRSSGTANNE